MAHMSECDNREEPKDEYAEYYDSVLVKEQPFYRVGMTTEEAAKEREYLNDNLQQFYEGKYIPLWRQNFLK